MTCCKNWWVHMQLQLLSPLTTLPFSSLRWVVPNSTGKLSNQHDSELCVWYFRRTLQFMLWWVHVQNFVFIVNNLSMFFWSKFAHKCSLILENSRVVWQGTVHGCFHVQSCDLHWLRDRKLKGSLLLLTEPMNFLLSSQRLVDAR